MTEGALSTWACPEIEGSINNNIFEKRNDFVLSLVTYMDCLNSVAISGFSSDSGRFEEVILRVGYAAFY